MKRNSGDDCIGVHHVLLLLRATHRHDSAEERFFRALEAEVKFI